MFWSRRKQSQFKQVQVGTTMRPAVMVKEDEEKVVVVAAVVEKVFPSRLCDMLYKDFKWNLLIKKQTGERPKDGRKDGQTNQHTDKPTDKQTDEQTDGQTGGLTNWWPDGWMDGHTLP